MQIQGHYELQFEAVREHEGGKSGHEGKGPGQGAGHAGGHAGNGH